MQDGQGTIITPNTPYEELLNAAGVHAPEAPSPTPPGGASVNSGNYGSPEDVYYNFRNKINSIPDSVTSPSSVLTASPFQIDTSGRYPYQRLGGDTEDLYAQGQSTWDKMWHGAAKGLLTAGTTFLQGTLGLVYGLEQVVTGHGAHSFYANDLSNFFNNLNQKAENYLPNYYSAKERTASWYQPGYWFTANFFWDQFVKNLGFSIGAIYSGAATARMLSLVPEAFSLGKAGMLARVGDEIEKTVTAVPDVERANTVVNTIKKASSTVNTLNTIVSPADRFIVSSLGAATEGGIEALQGVNDFRNSAIAQYKKDKGYAPTGQDLDNINDYASSLGNARFLLNMGLLTATNYVQLPKILSSSYKESKLVANGMERTLNPIVKDETTQLYKQALPSSKAGKLLYKSKNIIGLLFSPSEAFEEISQYGIELGVQDYYNKAYKGEGRDFLSSLATGYMNAFNSNEGMKQLLLGGISGGIQQSGIISTKGIAKTGELEERGLTGYGGERHKNTEEFLHLLNTTKLSLKSDLWLADMAKAAARGVNLQNEGEAYIRQGDVLESKDNEFDYAHNYLTPRIKYGRFDLVKDDIASYRQMSSSPEGWERLKQLGIANPNDTQATFQQRLANFETHATHMNSLYQSLNVRYGGRINKDTKQPLYSEETIDKMVYAASKVADYDERIPQLSAKLNLAGVSTQLAIDTIILNSAPNEAATKDALNQINNLDTLSENKDELKTNLRDLMELSLRRKMFLKQYDQLKEYPEEFDTPVPTPGPKAIVKGKELELGKEYALDTPIYREGNRLSVYPTSSIVSPTLGGEYELKTPFGETTYKKPSDIPYSLTDSPIQKDPKFEETVSKAIDKIVKTPDGSTLQDKLDHINKQDSKELTDRVEAQIATDTKSYLEDQKKAKEEAEKLAKDNVTKKALEDQQKASDNRDVIPPVDGVDDPLTVDPGDPKAPLPAFLSKEADYQGTAASYKASNVKPHQKRRLSFLTNFSTFTQQKQSSIRVLAITKNNEASYGLTGLVDWVKQDLINSLQTPEQREHYLTKEGTVKPEQEPIIKFYAVKTKEGIRPADVNGNAIENPGGENSLALVLSDGIFGTFHSVLSGTYEFGSAKGQQNYSGNYTKEQFAALQKQFNEWRTKILALKSKSPEYPIQSVSRGVVLRDENNKPVTETALVSEEDLLNKEGLITIPTTANQVVIGDIAYNFPVGYPLLTNGSNVEFLNNRQFTPKEAENIFQLIRERIRLGATAEAKRIEQFLSSILYLRSPRANESTAESQIYHRADGAVYNYHFGNNITIPFNVHALDSNKERIIAYLSSYYMKTNNKILQSSQLQGFEEAVFNPSTNSVDYKQHPSYQYFLLSPKATPSPLLQTKARKSVSTDDPSVISRYSTLSSSEFDFQAPQTPIPQPPKKTKLFGSRAEKEAAKQKTATPTPAQTSELESKKADIERRRQEELKYNFGTNIDLIASKRKPVISRQIIYSDKYKNGTRIFTDVQKGDEYAQALINDYEEINTKYDAELAALEASTSKENKKTPPAKMSLFGGSKAEKDALKKKMEEEKKAAKDKPFDTGEFKLVSPLLDYKKADIDKEMIYIKEKTPFAIHVISSLIKTPQGAFAWGSYKAMVIKLYNQAKEGTGYHEVFEGVWKVFTTQEQKDGIINEFRRRSGQFTYFDGTSYITIPYSQATEFEIKERLADEFADYVLAGGNAQEKGTVIGKWLSSLWDFIKSIFTGNVKHIDNLFSKIDAGHYKSMAYAPISPSEAEQFSLADVTYTQQYETVRGVALQVIQEMLNPNKENSISLTEWEETSGTESTVNKFYSDVYTRLNEIYTVGIYKDEMKLNDNPDLQEAYRQYWEDVSNDWDKIKELTTEYLRTFSIIETIKGDDEFQPSKDDTSNRDYTSDSKYFANDAKNTASRSIKLLFATLPETIADVIGISSKRTSATFMQQQVNYSKTFNSLMSQLVSINGMKEKEEKLKELGESFPNFKRLYQRLMTPSNPSNPNSVLNDWKLRVRFFQVFSKQRPTAWIQYNQAGKNSFTQTANLGDSKKIIIQGWIDTLKEEALSKSSKLASISSDGTTILNTRSLPSNLSTPEHRVAFVNALKIPFTIDDYRSLDARGRESFNKGVIGFASQLKKRSSYPLDTAKSLESIGNLEDIASAFIQAGNDFESTYLNLEKERQTQFISTNKISRDVNDFNNSSTKAALLSALPHLQQVGDSIYLNNILFNQKEERTSKQFEIGYIQGTLQANGKPIPGSKLSIHQRLTQEINQNLNDRYYILVPADGGTQWLLSMTSPVPFKTVASRANNYLDRTLDLFTTYYNTEKANYERLVEEIGEDRASKRATIFREISHNYTDTEDGFRTSMIDFIMSQVDVQKNLLEKFHTISLNRNGKSYTWTNLDGEFAQRENLNHTNLSKEDVDNILIFRTINFAINNIEQQKLLFGNILEYKDAKRYKLFLSPREISVFGVAEYNSYLNEHFNKIAGAPLKSFLQGKHIFSDSFPTVTMNDVFNHNEELAKISPAYKETNSTDASAISTLTAMRERHLKAGNWPDKAEEEYQYRMATDRLAMLEDGVLQTDNTANTDTYYHPSLKQHDERLVEKGNPNSHYIYVEKPILSGHVETDGTYHPIVDKFSIVSYSYTAVRNTNLREHFIKMMTQDIGYIIVNSGRKVGARSSDSFYDGEGNVNTAPYESIINVPFSAFGTQSDNSSKKEQQTRGTQMTKLAIVNLHNSGTPISTKAGGLVQHNISLLRELTEIGYQNLLKEIGAEDVDGEYRIVDKTKILKLVTDELLRREVADNIKQRLKLNPKTKDLATPFESLPNYLQIKNILYSYVDKNITSPKVGGGPKVQVSGALMEKYGLKRIRVGNKDVYTSDGLKFYTPDAPYCEVLLPAWVGKKLRKAGVEWYTEEELYNLFKSSPDGDKLLSGIGFRIPTQELNSIENFRIAGFLPEEMGDTVVVPEAITTKAGSDFDIDKLNTYLKNVYVDNKKQIRLIPYFGVGEEAKEKLKKWFNEDVAQDFLMTIPEWNVNVDPDDYITQGEYIDAREDAIFRGVDFAKGEEKAALAFDSFYRQSIENEYFNNLSDILSLPENFERLVTPNTADDLKGIRDKLVDLAPSEFDVVGAKSIISPAYMLSQRHQGLSIKNLVGISAVSQTGTAVAQLSDIRIDPARIGSLSYRETAWLGDANKFFIALPHNVDSEGYATISAIKDVEGRWITDKISQYINGTVDVFNDAFLAQIGFSQRTSPIMLLLERLGTPNSSKHPIVTYFINQPIIRQYLNLLDTRGINGLTDKNAVRDVKKLFSSSKKASPLSSSLSTLTSSLSDNIKKYYNGVDLTQEENAQQHLILKEFLKYAVIANNLFRFQQGTNYDTATLNDSNSLYFKEKQKEEAEDRNIFTDVNSYLASTFIGTQRNALLNATRTLTGVLKIENPLTKQFLSPIMERISRKWASIDTKNKMTRQLEESLINYLIQTKTGINNSIKYMMVDAETALVNQLKQFKKATKDTDSIWGNIILKQLIPVIKGNSYNSTKNITLAVKARDVVTKNIYADAFKQLYNHPATEQLARSLIKLSFLQNGISSSPISFKDSIPADLYSLVVNEGIAFLQDADSLNSFVSSGAYYRNNWDDEDVVPRSDSYEHQLGSYTPVIRYIESLKARGLLERDAPIPAMLWVRSSSPDSYSPFLSHTQFPEDGEEDVPTYRRLFRRVEDENGSPVRQQIEDEEGELSYKTLFIQTNAWGDSFRAQEYYPTPQQSVLVSGYQRVATELNPQAVANYISTGEFPASSEDEIKDAPKLQPMQQDFLKTFDFGSKEGTPQTKETDKIIHNNIVNHPDRPMYDEGESFNEAFKRVIPALSSLLPSASNNTLLITHNSVFGLIKLWDELGRPSKFSKEDRRKYTQQDNKFPTGSYFILKTTSGNVYVARHGDTEDNDSHVYRRANTELNANGIKQASDLGDALRSIPISQIVSSPLSRTMATAGIIADKQQQPPPPNNITPEKGTEGKC